MHLQLNSADLAPKITVGVLVVAAMASLGLTVWLLVRSNAGSICQCARPAPSSRDPLRRPQPTR